MALMEAMTMKKTIMFDKPNQYVSFGRPQKSDDAVFPKYCGN